MTRRLAATSVFASFLLVTFTAQANAELIYEFTPLGGGPPQATITFASPPASADSPWTTSVVADILNVTLSPTLFLPGLAPASALSWPPTPLLVFSPVLSSGPTLDFGIIILIPQLALNTSGELTLYEGRLAFNTSPAKETIGAFANGQQVFTSGDWTVVQPAAVSEPASIVLLIVGLGAVGLFRVARRRG